MAGEQTTASSAINTIQNDISIIPRNSTLGIKHFCLGYVNHVACRRSPLNLSEILSQTLVASNVSQGYRIDTFDQTLKYVSLGSLEGPIIVGVISAAILVIGFQYSFWKGGSEL